MIGICAWLVSSAAVWFSLGYWPALDDNLLRGLAGGYASTAGTMLGFVLAMITVLISMSDRRLIRNMARTGHYLRLLSGMYGCAIYFGAALAVSLPMLVLSCTPLRIGVALCSGLFVSAAIQLFQAGLKLWKVLKLISESYPGPIE